MLDRGDVVVPRFGIGQRGGVVRVDLASGAAGLVKPVGLALAGPFLYVSGQSLGLVLRARLAAPRRAIVIAAIEGVDALCPGPDRDGVFASTSAGDVVRITARGKVERMAGGFARPRGLAWDERGGRLFVADRSAAGTISLSILSLRP